MNNSFIIGVELTPEMNRFLAYWRSLLSFLKEYVFMLIVAFNLITNSINFFIFMKPNFKKVSVSFYLTLLSLSNIVASYVVIFFYVWWKLYSGNPIFQTFSYFPILLYFQSTIPFYTSWLSVCVILDRCLSTISVKVMNNLKARKLQISFCLILFMVLTSLNIPILLNKNINPVTLRGYYYDSIFPFIDLIVTTSLPFILMCFLNFKTVSMLKKSKLKFKMKKRKVTKEDKKQKRFLVTAIALNFLFFLTFVPQAIIQIWILILFNQTSGKSQLYSFLMKLQLPQVFALLKMIYFSTQILIYYVTNPIYRKELKRTVKTLTITVTK